MWREVDLQDILGKEKMGLEKDGYVGQGVVRRHEKFHIPCLNGEINHEAQKHTNYRP